MRDHLTHNAKANAGQTVFVASKLTDSNISKIKTYFQSNETKNRQILK